MGASKESAIQMQDDAVNGNRQILPMDSNSKNMGLVINSQSFLTASKDDIHTKAMAVVDDYLSGHKSPTEALIIVKKMIDFAEEVKSNISDAAANELRLAKSEKREVSGNSITEQMVGTRYSFKECQDPIWNELNEKIKEREAFLKTIKGSKQELIEETGEVVQIFEPVKSGKMGLIIKY